MPTLKFFLKKHFFYLCRKMNNGNTFIKNTKIINKGFQNKPEINIENYLMRKRI